MGESKLMNKVTRMAGILGEKDQAIQLSSQEPAAIFCVGVYKVWVLVVCLGGLRIRGVNVRVSLHQTHHTSSNLIVQHFVSKTLKH
jgi:hypothetical protein